LFDEIKKGLAPLKKNAYFQPIYEKMPNLPPIFEKKIAFLGAFLMKKSSYFCGL
jgi:hypothetical protein